MGELKGTVIFNSQAEYFLNIETATAKWIWTKWMNCHLMTDTITVLLIYIMTTFVMLKNLS